MSDRRPKGSRRTLLAGSGAAALIPAVLSSSGKRTWVATWPAPPTSSPPGEPLVLHDQTVRHVTNPSIGGDKERTRLTSEFGAGPLRIGEVRVGLRVGDGESTDVARGSGRSELFGGRRTVTIPAGAPAVSDP